VLGAQAIVAAGSGAGDACLQRSTSCGGAGLTPLVGSQRRSAEQGVADGPGAVRLTVIVFLVVDVVITLVGQAYGRSDWGRAGAVAAAQMVLVVAASTATLWGRTRLAVVLTAAVVGLVFTAGASGAELWLLVITAFTAAARAGYRQLFLVVLAQLAYGLCFGLDVERRHPGSGWSTGLLVVAFSAASLAAGLVGRRLLRLRDGRRLRVQEIARENARIRAVERARLADDLQTVVTGDLATIVNRIDTGATRADDAEGLRQVLTQVDADCRTLLQELRALLEILRAEPAAQPMGTPAGRRRWVDLLTARHVRLAATAVLGLLAVRVALGDLGSPTLTGPQLLVPVLGLLACAVAVWRPMVGAGCGLVALASSIALEPVGYWDALPVALLCLVAAARDGIRRLWLVVVGVASYGAVLTLTGRPDPGTHTVVVGYVGLLATATGLGARYFAQAQVDADRRLDDLMDERGQVESEERNAVARELHDVVAHQLSVTTMVIMATSLTDDPARLAETLDRVRHSIEAAGHELSVLLYAMRGPDSAELRSGPLITPLACADALARRLVENGYHPVLEIDPAADDVDPTTQRTLVRIMQEGATNMLRYTPAGSTCRFTLALDDDQVRLTIASPTSPRERTSDLSLGWGLRGIGERVDLSRGTFTAGPQDGQWVLAVTLPSTVGALSH
jgi:signal transduction histidine kinase